MRIDAIPAGKNPPSDINVVIEITGGAGGGAPVKYEIDKDSVAVFVVRIVNTPMFYPCNYGFVPNTLHADGDPTGVLVLCDFDLAPGVVIRCRPVGVLKMEDDGGTLVLEDAPHDEGWESGARVRLVFPRQRAIAARTSEANEGNGNNVAGKVTEEAVDGV